MMLLLRRYCPDRTEGKYVLPEGDLCYNLEPPDLNNKVGESCIPEGAYIVKPDKTGRFQWYRVQNVRGRTAIELHEGNTVEHTEGCLLPCMELVNGRGVSSREALNLIKDKFGDSGFVLEIRKWHPRDGKW